MDTHAAIVDEIAAHLAREAGVQRESITERTDLVASGLLDSFGILDLIMHIETTCGIRFDPVELTTDAARTVGGLARLAAVHRGKD
ncbi:MAG: acyl carrier protein [Planctomycetota bacterium]